MHELGHLGIHRPRRNDVDADARVAQFDGLLLAQVDQRALAGAIGHAQGAGAQARDGRDVDHRTAAGFEHHRRSGLRAQESAVEVGAQHMAPLFPAGLQDGLEDGHTGVVDQRVDAAKARHHGGHGRLHLLWLGDIAMHRQHMVGVGECGIGGGQRGGVDVDQRHLVAVRQEPACHGQADATRATGHHRDGAAC